MTIRKKFRNEIQIRVIKNRVAQRAFEKVKDIAGLEELSLSWKVNVPYCLLT